MHLGATLESVLTQTCPPAETIVIDDGSTDASVQEAERFGSGVRVLRQAKLGVSVARNAGIEAASAPYLMFLDADDLLHPRSLEVLTAAAAATPGSVALMGWSEFRESPDAPHYVRVMRIDSFFPDIIRTNFGPQHTRIVPRDAARQVNGFPAGMPIYEDWHFWMRVALLGTPLVSVDFVGALYRRHPSSCLATSREGEVVRGHVRVMEELCRGVLQHRPDLLQEHGHALLWAAWTAVHRARSHGWSWAELRVLAHSLEEIARHRQSPVSRTRFSRLIRLLGVPWAETLRNLYTIPVSFRAKSLEGRW